MSEQLTSNKPYDDLSKEERESYDASERQREREEQAGRLDSTALDTQQRM